MWDACETYVEHMWIICETYVKHMWNIWQTYVKHMWNICEAYVKRMWNMCQVFVKPMWNVWQTYVKHMWNTCETGAQQMWNICEPYVKQKAKTHTRGTHLNFCQPSYDNPVKQVKTKRCRTNKRSKKTWQDRSTNRYCHANVLQTTSSQARRSSAKQAQDRNNNDIQAHFQTHCETHVKHMSWKAWNDMDWGRNAL